MKITRLKNVRAVYYKEPTSSELPGTPVYQGETYEAFSLKIHKREAADFDGESNYLIREKGNLIRHLILYCRLPEPGRLNELLFWINDKVTIPPGEKLSAGELIDPEKASLWVMDFSENFLKKKYEFVEE